MFIYLRKETQVHFYQTFVVKVEFCCRPSILTDISALPPDECRTYLTATVQSMSSPISLRKCSPRDVIPHSCDGVNPFRPTSVNSKNNLLCSTLHCTINYLTNYINNMVVVAVMLISNTYENRIVELFFVFVQTSERIKTRALRTEREMERKIKANILKVIYWGGGSGGFSVYEKLSIFLSWQHHKYLWFLCIIIPVETNQRGRGRISHLVGNIIFKSKYLFLTRDRSIQHPLHLLIYTQIWTHFFFCETIIVIFKT